MNTLASPESSLPYFDAIIVGAGLGGLSTGLHLKKRGMRVALLEQASRVGGLCGTCQFEGREYVIACNDFGKAMPEWLASVGVRQTFTRHSTHIHYEGRRFSLPPDLRSIIHLLPHGADLIRYAKGQKASRASGFSLYPTVGALVNATVRHPMVADILKIPAYLMGVSPDTLRLDSLDDEFRFAYGYTQPTTPDGGPQAMADAMAECVRETGEIFLGTRYLAHQAESDGIKLVNTDRGQFRCRHLIDATARESAIAPDARRGLPLAMFWLAVDRQYNWPRGVHTNIHYPAGVSSWFGALERGELPPTFGFHVFKSDLATQGDCNTLNVYFYLPKGQEHPDADLQSKVHRYVFSRIESMLPGLNRAIVEQHFISPTRFTTLHGMSSRVLPVITAAGEPKPDNYDADRDIWYAGAASFPPGDHGSAAVLSGKIVADRIAGASADKRARSHTEGVPA
ncbi:NAD(P)-binding protein [Burkholderiaceae bacterium DAT-1]|nr:NAD(P)-binding protein [Burkholderiaceae bacterium DAT-1]